MLKINIKVSTELKEIAVATVNRLLCLNYAKLIIRGSRSAEKMFSTSFTPTPPEVSELLI